MVASPAVFLLSPGTKIGRESVPAGHVAEKATDPTGHVTVNVYDEASRLKTVTV